MFEEKVYIMDDGTEYVLGSYYKLDDKCFLLLYEKKSDNVFIAYEENDNLIFIGEEYPGYKEVFGLLLEKFNNRS